MTPTVLSLGGWFGPFHFGHDDGDCVHYVRGLHDGRGVIVCGAPMVPGVTYIQEAVLREDYGEIIQRCRACVHSVRGRAARRREATASARVPDREGGVV